VISGGSSYYDDSPPATWWADKPIFAAPEFIKITGNSSVLVAQLFVKIAC
jgi:hypothetical protein